MCGLVGIAGDLGLKGEKAFKRMLELDTYRGPHSTGVFSVKNNNETMLVKQLGTPWDLYEYRAFNTLMAQHSIKVLLGHNRWATKGKINKANAHPFEFDNVVGAHNGTLTSVTNLKDHLKFDVDSENLYHDMNINGAFETLPKLQGAFALTWFDKNEQTINLIRNDERPLYYAFSEDKKILFWASESWMIELGAGQAGIKLLGCWELPVGVLFTFDVPMLYPIKEFDKVRTRKIELYKALPRTTYYGNASSTNNSTTKALANAGATTSGKTKRPFASYQKHVNTSVVFSVGSAERSRSGQQYIQCWLNEDVDISIRVFAQVDGVLWKQMMESPNYFSGVAKSYTSTDDGYLTIDLRTIVEEEILDIDVPDETYTVFDGEEVDAEEFKERTKKCCSWCSSPADLSDAPELHWFSKDGYICGSCAEQDEVKQYLK